MKQTKRLFAVLLAVMMLLSAMPVMNVGAISINDSSVFLHQPTDGDSTCVFTSCLNMFRRRAIIDGDSEWGSITHNNYKNTITTNGVSVRWTITDVRGMNASMNSDLTSNKKNYFISMLNNHPEGIVIYCGSSPMHTVLLTDYDSSTDTFYCAETLSSFGYGRIPLTSCYLSTYNGGLSQSSVISKISQIWYVSNRSGGGTPTTAPTYATIYTDNYSYAVNERVNFHMSSDGTVNNLWIYCPNGQTLTYKDVGTNYDLGFGMSGEFEALVQTWNEIGNYTSERIHFLVGNPTKAILSTDHSSYAVDETVTFSCDTNGTPNCNVIWIYCPNGSSLHYSDIGNSMKLGFGMSGEFEALVQAWSSTGSLSSERIRFIVGPPTRALISSNKQSYSIGEEIILTCDTNGSENSNCVWIYGPNGETKSYTKVGTQLKVTLDKAGTYEALVQAWNRADSLTSKRISFTVVSNHTHSYSSTVTTPATCIATGIKTLACSCGASYTETIGKNANNHVNTTNVAATASTCTVKGYTAGVYCNDCKKYISGHAEQPLAAHTLTTINHRDATYDAEGYTGDTYCTTCKQTIAAGTVIPKLEKPTDPTPSNPQPSGGCKWCGQNHGGAFGWLVKLFHNLFAAIFGAKY